MLIKKRGDNVGCIYMYTNKLNGKKYIGQTTRPLKIRHWQHLSQNVAYIDRALKKYGIENFTLTVLEDNIDDVNELNKKEIYYIDKYNTFNDGYNLNRGGDNHTSFSYELRDAIIHQLKYTSKTSCQIAQELGCSVYTIYEVNIGNTLPLSTEQYPIRKHGCYKYNSDEIDSVIEMLTQTSFSFDKIAELTNTNFNFVADINRGKRTFLDKQQYDFPLRKGKQQIHMTIELAEQIVSMLKESELSSEEIGERLGVPGHTVGSINRGTHSICNALHINDYPIRKKQFKKTPKNKLLSKEQLINILDLLFFTNLSMEEIGQRFGISKSTITAINTGRNYYNDNQKYKFPLRQNKQTNIPIFSNAKE